MDSLTCFRLLFLLLSSCLRECESLSFSVERNKKRAASKSMEDRRQFLQTSAATYFLSSSASSPAVGLLGGVILPSSASAASNIKASISELRDLLQRSSSQLDPVPKLIKEEKWDAVRAILITPPISDLWAKSSITKAILQKYAEQLGDAGGDELAALEAREDLISHLRYLDMAVYNNVFNPIASEGTAGATKELVRSYYEDPINEYKAVVALLKEMIALSDGF